MYFVPSRTFKHLLHTILTIFSTIKLKLSHNVILDKIPISFKIIIHVYDLGKIIERSKCKEYENVIPFSRIYIFEKPIIYYV